MTIKNKAIADQILKQMKKHYEIHSKYDPEAWFLKNDAKAIKRIEKRLK